MLLAIPNAISAAVSEMSQHGHKKGVKGSSSTDSTSSTGDQAGTTQSLFGSLLDSAEQVVGIQTPTTTPPPSAAAVTGAASTLASLNTGAQTSTASMISAARSALHKI
jgi:hypothetical protein